jgi:hypothetical protein
MGIFGTLIAHLAATAIERKQAGGSAGMTGGRGDELDERC